MRPLLALALCALLTSPAKADPGPVVNWLVNEPASVFDIGMMQLRSHLKEMESEWRLNPRKSAYGPIQFHAFYDLEINRIGIQGWLDFREGELDLLERSVVESVCDDFFRSIRISAGVSEHTGDIAPGISGGSFFSDFFNHVGYINKSAPENYQRRLDRIFTITLKYPTLRFYGTDRGPRYTCSGPLLDTGFSMKKDEAK